jgi:hypothetical protein
MFSSFTELQATMIAELKPKAAITAQQMSELQARLDAIHASKLITAEELYLLWPSITFTKASSDQVGLIRCKMLAESRYEMDDIVADGLEVTSQFVHSVVTMEVCHANPPALKMQLLVALSEGIQDDARFSRQLRRKFL